MRNYFQHIILLAKRIVFLLILFSISRIYFYILNLSFFENSSFWEILKSFIYGVRFDIASIAFFNSLFIVLHIIPGNYKNKKVYQIVLFTLFILVNSILLLTNFIDSEYFAYTNKRMSIDIGSLISLGDDFKNLVPQFLKDFWYTVLAFLVMVYGSWKKYPRKSEFIKDKLSLKTFSLQILIFVTVIAISFVAFRGVGLRPLNNISAAKYVRSQNIQLVLNTPFTMLKSYSKENLTRIEYFLDEKLNNIYEPITIPKTTHELKNVNVVVIILESFSAEFVGYISGEKSFTPFLDSLFSKSLVFTNAFANGKRSIEALPAIFTGIPSFADNPYITSKYSMNNIKGIGTILKEKGYTTSFYHGGINGTMGFDAFAHLAGFDKYYGMNEYPTKKDFDGTWGIYDEEYLQYYAEELSKIKSPFLSCVFTLSSHHPYKIPERYEGKFPKGNHAIKECISYVDYSLKQFFESASKTDWFKNTLFVFTADHTPYSSNPYYSNKLGSYSIPIAYYFPNDTFLLGKNSTITQQCDITPTILGLLGYNEPIFSFGRNVLDTTISHCAFNYNSVVYQLIENGYTYLYDGEKSKAIYDIHNDKLLKSNLLLKRRDLEAEMEPKLKAIIQAYNNRMIDNKLTISE